MVTLQQIRAHVNISWRVRITEAFICSVNWFLSGRQVSLSISALTPPPPLSLARKHSFNYNKATSIVRFHVRNLMNTYPITFGWTVQKQHKTLLPNSSNFGSIMRRRTTISVKSLERLSTSTGCNGATKNNQFKWHQWIIWQLQARERYTAFTSYEMIYS